MWVFPGKRTGAHNANASVTLWRLQPAGAGMPVPFPAGFHTTIRRLAPARSPRSGGSRLQYFFFHLMPWPYLPADFDAKYDSAWVWLPNSLYDPVKGR